MNLSFEKVIKDNLELAIKTQNAIFPEENGALNFKFSVDKKLMKGFYEDDYEEALDFWLVRDSSGNVVGITGIYCYINYLPNDAWLAWYGVLFEHRRKGYGKDILLWTINKAKERGYKNFRLYTDLIENNEAVDLYRKLGMIEEPYLAEDMGDEKTFIFSKSLSSKNVEKIGNKNLFLKRQENIQKQAEF
jgi:GNAT superfamily N-acetyltransferase